MASRRNRRPPAKAQAKAPATETAEATAATETATATTEAPEQLGIEDEIPTLGTVTLVNNIQLRQGGQIQRFHAGRVYELGSRVGQIPPGVLERQPLLNFDHDANQRALAKLRELDEKAARNPTQFAVSKLAKNAGRPPVLRKHGIV